MDDMPDRIAIEQQIHRLALLQSAFHEAEAGKIGQDGEPGPFQRRIIVIVDVVEPDDFFSLAEQVAGEVKSDETGSACDEDRVLHAAEIACKAGTDNLRPGPALSRGSR